MVVHAAHPLYSSFISSLGSTPNASANFLNVEALAPLLPPSRSLKVACATPVILVRSCWESARSLRRRRSAFPSTDMNLSSAILDDNNIITRLFQEYQR